jgi:hypothetical protein
MVHGIGAGPVRCGMSTGDGLDEVDKVEAPAATSRWERRLSIREVATSGLRLHIPRLSGHRTAGGARGGRGNASPVPPPARRSRCLPHTGVSTDRRPASSMPAKCTASGPAAAARVSKRAYVRPNPSTETGAADCPIGRRFGGTSFYSIIRDFETVKY